MRTAHQTVSRLLLTVATLASLWALVRAQRRTEVTIKDTGVQAENVTSSQDGSVYFGSTAKGTIYRAAVACAGDPIGSHPQAHRFTSGEVRLNIVSELCQMLPETVVKHGGLRPECA